MNFCIRCLNLITNSQTLCEKCYQALIDSKEPKTIYLSNKKFKSRIYVYTLFRYENAIRDLIISAKAHQNLRALNFLTTTVQSFEKTSKLIQWADVLIPAPSSLWSRFHGKYDIAFYIADSLSKKFKKPLTQVPYDLFWNIKKRSMKHKNLNTNFALSIIEKFQKAMKHDISLHNKNILIIDDVITTGLTIRTILDRIYSTNKVKIVTLARAFNSNKIS